MIKKIKSFFSDEKFVITIFCILLVNIQFSYSCLNYNYVFQTTGKIIRYIVYLLLFISAICKLRKKEINIKLILITILGLLISYFSHNYYILITLIVIIALKDIDFKAILKYAIPTTLLTFAFIITLSVIGVIPNWTSLRGNGDIRYYLGYNFATIPSTYYFTILLLIFYYKDSKISYLEIILQLLISVLLYSATDSKTGFILSIIVIVAMLANKICANNKKENKKSNNKSLKDTLLYVFPWIINIAIFVVIVLYSNNNIIGIRADKILNNRVRYATEIIRDYGVKPFGEKIDWQGWGGYGHTNIEEFEYNFVDDSYIYFLMDNGIIFYFIFLIGYTFLLIDANNAKDNKLIFCLILILIWAIIEPNILNIDKNIFLLLLSKNILFVNKKNKEEKKNE